MKSSPTSSFSSESNDDQQSSDRSETPATTPQPSVGTEDASGHGKYYVYEFGCLGFALRLTPTRSNIGILTNVPTTSNERNHHAGDHGPSTLIGNTRKLYSRRPTAIHHQCSREKRYGPTSSLPKTNPRPVSILDRPADRMPVVSPRDARYGRGVETVARNKCVRSWRTPSMTCSMSLSDASSNADP